MSETQVTGSTGSLAHIPSALVQVTAEMPATSKSPLMAADTLEAQLHYCFFGLAASERGDLATLARAMRGWHQKWTALEAQHRDLEQRYHSLQNQARLQALRLSIYENQARRWWRFWR